MSQLQKPRKSYKIMGKTIYTGEALVGWSTEAMNKAIKDEKDPGRKKWLRERVNKEIARRIKDKHVKRTKDMESARPSKKD